MVVILANDESSDRTGSEFAVDAACSAAYRTEPHEHPPLVTPDDG